jgi:hypothetical protein
MARFSRERIEKGTAPQTAWKKVKEKLVTHQSVEVVFTSETDQYTGFELHAWTGEREDGSNGPDASPGEDY